MKTGRNAPCPCGSGKKHKHCCLNPASVVSDELQQLLAGQELNSLEEVQALTHQFMQQRNQRPLDSFQGLSPEQVHRMLSFPFDSPALFSFPEVLSKEPQAPLLELVQWIADAIDDKGLKATAKGNLPQKLCRQAALNHWKNLSDDDLRRHMSVNKEEDFMDLHVTRITMELAGLLRKTRGRFFLTRKYRRIVKQGGNTTLYPLLFRTYCEEFNWAYWDHYPDVPIIQHSFLFTLYLLQQHGNDWKPSDFYIDSFIRAFPMVLEEVESLEYLSAEGRIRHCYGFRMLERFLPLMGLCQTEEIPGDSPLHRNYQIKKSTLLDEVVNFST